MLSRRLPLTLSIVGAAVFPSVSHAQAHRDPTATAGPVTATVLYDESLGVTSSTGLVVSRGGSTVFDRLIPKVCSTGCTVDADGGVTLVDLDADAEPEVVVRGFSGGAHCCETMGVYDWRPRTATYGELVRDWRSSGFRITDLDRDGRPEVVGRDVRFEDAFSSHGSSFSPPEVDHYEGRGGRPRLTHVTRSFPAVIRENARAAARRIARLRRGDDGRSVVAAYVADQILLGRGTDGRRVLRRQEARGTLGARRGAAATLLRRLRGWGYR
jgi:hypothetical protein